MPIISALLGLGTGVGITMLLTYAFDIPNVTLTLAVMIGLAVGTIMHYLFYLDIVKLLKANQIILSNRFSCRNCR